MSESLEDNLGGVRKGRGGDDIAARARAVRCDLQVFRDRDLAREPPAIDVHAHTCTLLSRFIPLLNISRCVEGDIFCWRGVYDFLISALDFIPSVFMQLGRVLLNLVYLVYRVHLSFFSRTHWVEHGLATGYCLGIVLAFDLLVDFVITGVRL